MLNELPGSVFVKILGIMQDGGLPHAGCQCARCSQVYENTYKADYVACLGIVDRRSEPSAVWLIDATPDIKYQLNLLRDYLGPHPTNAERLRQPDGIFLTHAHIGHVAGLAQFSRPAMTVRQLKIFASSRLALSLRDNDLWYQVQDFDFVPLVVNVPIKLALGLYLTPIAVPHRDEKNTGTFAFFIQGPEKSLLYLPDIDNWEVWPQAENTLSSADYALVDATFFSGDELGGTIPVAHPLIPQTIDLFSNLNTHIVLTHINHTNPLLDIDSPERESVFMAGVEIAETGQIYTL